MTTHELTPLPILGSGELAGRYMQKIDAWVGRNGVLHETQESAAASFLENLSIYNLIKIANGSYGEKDGEQIRHSLIWIASKINGKKKKK